MKNTRETHFSSIILIFLWHVAPPNQDSKSTIDLIDLNDYLEEIATKL